MERQCFSDAEYLIYCYQTNYDSLKEEYGNRAVLYTPTAIGNVETETAAPQKQIADFQRVEAASPAKPDTA